MASSSHGIQANKDDKVLEAKTELMQAMGDKWPTYLSYMNFYFRQKWTKKELDSEAMKLLPPNKVRLHNLYFRSILIKIGAINKPMPTPAVTMETTPTKSGTTAGSGSSRKRKRSTKLVKERTTFETTDLAEFLIEEMAELTKPNADSSPPAVPCRYLQQELFLPDSSLILGRFVVAAWELGLVNVDTNVAELIIQAVQDLMKNILTAILMKKKHYKTSNDFFYDMGHPLKDPFVRNTATRDKYDDEVVDLDKEFMAWHLPRRQNDNVVFLAACEEDTYPVARSRINILDLYKVLQDPNVIPIHSVHAINIERISQMLN